MKKVLITFGSYTAELLLKICRNAISKCKGNANFPDLDPTIAIMETKADEFQQAISNADEGSKLDIAIKKEQQKQLASLLRNWALYVNLVSKGDAVKIASSGLPEAKTPEPTKLTAPVNIKVLQALNPNGVIIKFKRPKGAKSFVYFWTPDPLSSKSVWQNDTSVRAKFQIDDLNQGKKYWFKVQSVGSNEQAAISEEVAAYVIPRTQDLGT